MTQKEKQPFLAFTTDAVDSVALKEFAASRNFSADCIIQGDIKTAAEYLKSNKSPELLIVEIPSAEEAASLLDKLADVCDPGTKVIVTGTVNEYSFYCWLMNLGIFSYLLRPLKLSILEETYQRSITKPTIEKGAEAKAPAKIFAFMGARGGVGCSTIALNIAGIIAEYSDLKVALIDADTKQGTLSLMLDIEPARGLKDALEKPDRIDTLFIDRVMSKAGKNLSVMSAEESIYEPIDIAENTAEILLNELSGKYDVIIIDIPRYLNSFTSELLKKSERLVLVSELNLQSLRDVIRVSDLMQTSLKKPAPIVIANKIGIASKNEISINDFEKGISNKIAEKITFSQDIFMQIGTTIPAVDSIKNPAVKPLLSLA